MFKVLLLLIITPEVLIAANNSDEISSKNQGILPLILIRTENDELIHPIKLDIANTDNDKNLLFGSTFIAKKDGKQLFFCGQAPRNENIEIDTDGDNLHSEDQYCSYELPEPRVASNSNYLQCDHEPEPFVQKIINKEVTKEGIVEVPESCKSVYIRGFKFAFVYEVKTNDDNKKHIFEVYRFCYNEERNTVLFTEHIIAAPQILDPSNDLFERERSQTYEMSDKSYGFFGEKYILLKDAYKELKDLKSLPNKKRHRDRFEDLLSDQKLVPTDDLPLALWRKTTYHFLNVRPMKDERIELWNYISQLIREDAIKKSKEYHILAGAFDVTNEGKNNNLIQPPDFWVKVVHYNWQESDENYNESVAIIMNQNQDIKFITTIFNQLSEENLCENVFNEKFPDIGKFVCCVPAEKVGFFFNLQFENHKLLEIDSIIK